MQMRLPARSSDSQRYHSRCFWMQFTWKLCQLAPAPAEVVGLECPGGRHLSSVKCGAEHRSAWPSQTPAPRARVWREGGARAVDKSSSLRWERSHKLVPTAAAAERAGRARRWRAVAARPQPLSSHCWSLEKRSSTHCLWTRVLNRRWRANTCCQLPPPPQMTTRKRKVPRHGIRAAARDDFWQECVAFV